MTQVTRSEFFAAIGPLDVQVRVRGRYHDADYGTDFVLKTGAVLGRTVAVGTHPSYKPDNAYFLMVAE